ncbi:MFS transporter [Alicyclobacillus ferrooxydans]|uniref:MFS transporter n=1 Tax=Alicyclobacillus ferrooxydans TaxID=471514 RepID=A0A0P9CB17_9BACL|nr:MFS transporter [Alicyclobacillus ferrooxydans]KPV42643.1 MFS transporter [Alicyclobacillus ferrooxydans]
MQKHKGFRDHFRQPHAAWAVAFAVVVAFMGLGLVDPILTSIAKSLKASPSQVELLFTSYMLVTAVMMVISGAVSSKIGPKWTLLSGLFIIVVFAALAGTSNTVAQVVLFRGGWGLGNALFISTALAVIVGVASGGTESAVILYEAALGLGLSVGPLLGGQLGAISWRGPFYGVSVLMLIGFFAIAVMLPKVPKPKRSISVLDPFRALRHKGLRTMAVTAFFYNYGFYTLFAFTPFVLKMNAHGLGFVFFGWGVMMAVFSVFVAPWFEARFATHRTMYFVLSLLALDLLVMGLTTAVGKPIFVALGIMWSARAILITSVILGGCFMGIMATLLTTGTMEAAPVERSVASSAYSFVRFLGGAVAPWLAGRLAESFNPSIAFYAGTAALVVSVLVLFSGRKSLIAKHH